MTDDGASVPRSTWEVNSNFHLLTSKLFQSSQTSEKQNKPCSYCTATKLLVVLIFSFKSVFHHSISPSPPRSSPLHRLETAIFEQLVELRIRVSLCDVWAPIRLFSSGLSFQPLHPMLSRSWRGGGDSDHRRPP